MLLVLTLATPVLRSLSSNPARGCVPDAKGSLDVSLRACRKESNKESLLSLVVSAHHSLLLQPPRHLRRASWLCADSYPHTTLVCIITGCQAPFNSWWSIRAPVCAGVLATICRCPLSFLSEFLPVLDLPCNHDYCDDDDGGSHQHSAGVSGVCPARSG